MTPSFFLTLCLGAVAGLTPLAVYLVAITAINRRSRPSVVSGVWEFVGMLAGMSGLIFCTGVVLASAATDARLITGGVAQRIPSHMPWAGKIWQITMGVYLTGLLVLIARGLWTRRRSVSVYAADPETVENVITDAFMAIDQPFERRGDRWHAQGHEVLRLCHFGAFKHSQLVFCQKRCEFNEELERYFRSQLPKQPGAESPAGPWLTTALTWCLVVVGCCVVLIFAMPFIR